VGGLPAGPLALGYPLQLDRAVAAPEFYAGYLRNLPVLGLTTEKLVRGLPE